MPEGPGSLGDGGGRRIGVGVTVIQSGRPDFQPVIAGIYETGHTDALFHIGQRAAAHHPDAETGEASKLMQDCSVARAQGDILRAGGYIGEGAIEIEQEQNLVMPGDQGSKPGRQQLRHGGRPQAVVVRRE